MKTGAFLVLALAASSLGAEEPQRDSVPLSGGNLKISFLGHATLMLDWNGWIIHVDPVSAEADYANLPKADLVLVTHEHSDHLDAKLGQAHLQTRHGRRGQLGRGGADSPARSPCATGNGGRSVPWRSRRCLPTTSRQDTLATTPRGGDNGYLLTVGGKRVYIAGDTENTPEMKSLKDVYIAFLPMNQPYTMTPEQVADAARAFHPQILYPYHTGETDTRRFVELLKGSGIDVRIRKLK